VIEVEGLTKKFGAVTAVSDLSFTVPPGQVTGFLGPNGAGKSTTMRMILGLDRPTAGRALVTGRPYTQLKQPLQTVGSLLDAKWVHPNRSARSHLRWMAATNGLSQARVDEVLELVGLAAVAKDRAGGFSLGMSQRLGLAAALLGDPPVLVLDEPVNGLDPEGIVWIRRMMQHLAGEGRTVLVSSHLLSEMADTASHLVVIGQGKLIADTTIDEFVGRASHNGVRVRTPQPDVLRPLLAAHWTVSDDPTDDPGALLVEGPTTDQVGELAAANAITLYELSAQRASLEEAFMQLTGSAVQYHAVEGAH
jgi:ABC-2 type transport system ATP-binding protein